MKILLFTEASGAGVGRHLIDLAEGLGAASHECHVLYGTARMDSRFASRIARQPFAQALPVQKNPGFSDLSVLRQLRHYMRLHGPFDILHAHSTKAGLLLRLAAIGCAGSVIYTPHAPLTMNPGLPSPVRGLLALFEFGLSKLTHRMIAVSPEEADHLASCGVPRRKLSVVPNGIERPPVESNCRFSVSGPVCIGYLGRLSSQKNVTMLLEAFAAAFSHDEAVSLAIAGTGPELASLRAKSQSLGIQNHIDWIGSCTADVMSTFDIFALPSSYEGMPYVLLEALSAGLPVVATAVGGVRSVIDDGEQGFVVPPGDTRQFAAALRKLATDGILRAKLGRQASIRASKFTVDRMVSETLSAYRQATAAHRSSRIPVRTSPAAAD